MSTALITGASVGLGAEFAKLFAKDGHDLILVSRRKDALETLAAQLRSQAANIQVHVIDMDLGKPNAGRILFEKTQSLNLQVDFLVNNAGFGSQGHFKDLALNKELQMIDLNVRTVVELTHLFLPAMVARKKGRVLNVGSTAGFQPGPYMATYYASKAFVNSFSEALHEELKGSGVTCTVLTPGATATEFAATSGNAKSRLFQSGGVASAESVALRGYQAMLAGQAVVIPGFRNKAAVQALRVSPRFAARKIASYLNKAAT